MTEQLRLDKALSNMGIASRKEVKDLVRAGRILVNEVKIKSSDIKITTKDCITIDDQNHYYRPFVYYMLNKPAGFVSATTDAKDRTVIDLLKSARTDLFPVGRLDKDTVGLLLITNDGALSHRLLSPKKHVPKTYYAKLDGCLSSEDIKRIEEGVVTSTETFLPAELCIHKNEGCAEVSITIYEGKYHEVKRIFQAVGAPVTYLKRLSMGPLQLDETLKEGEFRELTDKEFQLLSEMESYHE